MGVCKDCALKENCAEYKPNKLQCEDYERHKEVLTNEEWLHTLNTEQLAEWITELSDQCTIRHQCELCDGWCDEKRVVEWLKQPHREEKKK